MENAEHWEEAGIGDYQHLIDQAIRHLGGYWRSISALARLIEEVGEISELLINPPDDQNALGSELADLFIISTCLANQYLIDLPSAYADQGMGTKISELSTLTRPGYADKQFFQLVVACGRVARIINHYDGDKVKKPSEKDRTLRSQITELHRALIGLANRLTLNLFDYVRLTVEKDLKRDKNRFHLTHDPITESSRENFLFRRKKTDPSRDKEKIWGARPWEPEQSIEENVSLSVPSLIRFSKCCRIEDLDGFVFEIRGGEIKRANDFVDAILSALATQDPQESSGRRIVSAQGYWHFTFNDVPFRVSVWPEEQKSYDNMTHFICFEPESHQHAGAITD